jgi:hypothetical protein
MVKVEEKTAFDNMMQEELACAAQYVPGGKRSNEATFAHCSTPAPQVNLIPR